MTSARTDPLLKEDKTLLGYATQMRITMQMAGEVSASIRVTTQDMTTVGILRLGNIYIEVTDVATARSVYNAWFDARVQAASVAARISPEWIARHASGASVSAQARLVAEPVITSAFMPRVPDDREPTPAHVRLSVGPLVWEIFDKQAWQRFGDSWRTLVNRMI